MLSIFYDHFKSLHVFLPQATSQYQKSYARMAFPCLDEPSIKAEFTITLAQRWKF